MREFYLVVEILDPLSPNGVTNHYVSLDADRDEVSNGFRALRTSGNAPTGTVSRAQRVNGVLERIEAFPPQIMNSKGWRTMSAFLRA